MGNLLTWLLAAVAVSWAVMVSIMVFTETLTRWFAAGMRIKKRHELDEYTGWRFVGAAVFVLGFIVADFVFRNTVIVIQCQAPPAFELVTDYIERITSEPVGEPLWRLAIAVDYRLLIERYDPQHFSQPNRALAVLQRRYAQLG